MNLESTVYLLGKQPTKSNRGMKKVCLEAAPALGESTMGGPSFRRFAKGEASSLLSFLCVSPEVAVLRASVSPW
jgi:hypothetical protein